MPRDDLNDPLGMDLDHAHERQRAIPWGQIALAGCGILGLSLTAFAYLNADAPGGEPIAISAVMPAKKIEPPPVATPALPAVNPDVTGSTVQAKETSTADEVEMQSGVRVVRRGGAGAPGAVIIQIPQSGGGPLASAPDKRLVEKSRFGLLPRLGPDGSRAADIYARPPATGAALKVGAPKIALMVGGMGLSTSITRDAIEQLPAAVTLAFAPYGTDLERQVGQARAQGHEIVLQAPMEPFDYPQNDPGQHTLRQNVDAAETLDDLHWVMGRFTGYVGVANFLGARFTANPAALTPVLQDIASRGLVYVDDGASAQSQAIDIAASIGLTAMRADVVVDANSKPEAIAASLVALESLARKNGTAFGVASALPASVEQIARFAKALEARGIALVPVSALASRTLKPTAQRQ